MTNLKKIALRKSQISKRFAELAELEEQTPETRAEVATLTTEVQDLETRHQAALLAGETEEEQTTTTDVGEDRELRELRENAEFGRYLEASLERRSILDGAEKELNEALNVPLDRFPLELLADDLETRATVDGESGRSQQSWLERLFADSAASALGITMPSVAPGVPSYPLLNSGADPAQRGRTQDAVVAPNISATVTEIKPTRNAVHAEYSVEDDARLPGLAQAIRRDLSAAMVEKIDRTIFLGDSGANENSADITGLITAAITELTLTQANKVKGDEILKLLAGLIDGKYAASIADLNIVATVGSNQIWLGTVQNSAASNETIAQFLSGNGVSWRTRGEIEAATANGDYGAFIGLGRGIAGTAVAPVWNSGSMIVDPYSKAKSGEVLLTLNYLWGFQIPRTANYRRLKYVT